MISRTTTTVLRVVKERREASKKQLSKLDQTQRPNNAFALEEAVECYLKMVCKNEKKKEIH